MRKTLWLLLIFLLSSCRNQVTDSKSSILTVSISPFKFFVEEIAGDDFIVNVMVPAGANPHIYEPFPEQINKLRRSVGYISNGYLGFEMTWLDRFYETNKTMKRLSLGDSIDPLISDHDHDGEHAESVDPHYWVSPKCAIKMAFSVKEFLSEINPSQKNKYESNCQDLIVKISELERRADEFFSTAPDRSFMIFHPNLGYLARDYGLKEITVEHEGKEPTPSRMKYLIDEGRKHGLKTIFVQREYDTKNAQVIADEIGAELLIIDPLSEDWLNATSYIISAIHSSFKESSK